MAEREPLGDLFIGDGKYAVLLANKGYGPFLNEFVARQWGTDAFGAGFSVIELDTPWRIPEDERKF